MTDDSPPIVLTFGLSDPTGGSGVQADILTLASMGLPRRNRSHWLRPTTRPVATKSSASIPTPSRISRVLSGYGRVSPTGFSRRARTTQTTTTTRPVYRMNQRDCPEKRGINTDGGFENAYRTDCLTYTSPAHKARSASAARAGDCRVPYLRAFPAKAFTWSAIPAC